MSENLKKICPLRRIENPLDNLPEEQGKGLCIEEDCAWYFAGDKACGILSLAISLDSLAREGR